tara:strand:- start:396 stop:581 length:186 start_codon:yes stop_codon:yes gene_type:complete
MNKKNKKQPGITINAAQHGSRIKPWALPDFNLDIDWIRLRFKMGDKTLTAQQLEILKKHNK